MTWSAQVGPLLLLAALLLVPGLVAGAALGLRRIALVTSAPLLSYAALTVAIMLGSRTHLRWGLGSVALGTLVLAGVLGAFAVASTLVVPRLRPARRTAREHLARRGLLVETSGRWRVTPTSWEDLGVLLVSAAFAGASLLWVVVRTVAHPDDVQQSWDAVFHLNAIERVASSGSASPATVGQTANLSSHGSFYPPLFHALASLLVTVAHTQVTTAANLVAVGAACLVWPLSVLGLVWSVAPRRTTVAAAALVLTVVTVFPVLLMSFGVLWPNLLGLAALPAALALLAGVVGPVRAPTTPGRGLVAGLVAAAGLYYAHPGTLFAAIAMCLPLLVMALARLAWALGRSTADALAAWAGVLVGVMVLAAGWFLGSRVWSAVDDMKAVKTLRAQNWEAVESYPQAIGEALLYTDSHLHPLYVVGALTIVGAGVVVHDRRVWLAAGHAITVYLYMLAAGTDESIATTLTGFWYNDRFRLLAMLPVTGLPLAAIGLAWCADHLRSALEGIAGPARIATRPDVWRRGIGVASLAVVTALAAWATPYTLARSSMEKSLAVGYEGQRGRVLSTPAEDDLYRSLAHQPDPGKAVAGDPYTGAALAAPLSGRPAVFGHMRNSLDADQDLVGRRFKDFTRDPAVCRAVKDLDIGYVTEDTELFPGDPDQRAQYAGLRGLAGTPGLTLVAREGTVSAYRVGDCRS